MLATTFNKNRPVNTAIESIFPTVVSLESLNCEHNLKLINKNLFLTRNPRLYNKPNLL